MTQRIAIFGFESSGKTTLAADLARYYAAPVAWEYVRNFWDARRGYITAADLAMIARGQIAAEESAARTAGALVFCDTELLTNCLWFDLLFPGRCPPWVRGAAEQRSRHYGLYLLCDSQDVPYTPDPQRGCEQPEIRQQHARTWRDALVCRGLPVVALSGDRARRLRQAIDAVDTLLSHPAGIVHTTCGPA